MTDEFSYDVFLSYSPKDKAVVSDIASRLRAEGLHVWFDDWELRFGDTISVRLEEGLESARVLVLCISTNAIGLDWAELEASTFRFRDPLNKNRRFIPLRLDGVLLPGSLAQLSSIDWRKGNDRSFTMLFEACRPELRDSVADAQVPRQDRPEKAINFYSKEKIKSYAFSTDGKRVLFGGGDGTLRLVDMETGHCRRIFWGHKGQVLSVVWSIDQRYAASGGSDSTVRIWEVETGRCLDSLKGHDGEVHSVVWNNGMVLSGGEDKTIRNWNNSSSSVIKGHDGPVFCLAMSIDQRHIISGSADGTMRLWDLVTGNCLRVFEGHTGSLSGVALSGYHQRAISAASDHSLRLWNLDSGRCLRIFKGHSLSVESVAWSFDERQVISGSSDRTVRLWDVETGDCLCVAEGHASIVNSVAWNADQARFSSGDSLGGIRVWDHRLWELSEPKDKLRLPEVALDPQQVASDQILYTNAKVLLVGDSGAGKTGLSKALAGEQWFPSDSTVGAWATQWKLPVSSSDGVEREIWLWDFGGQADQRLIHQLYMDDAALAVLVFDGQKEDLFETLGQWDRDLIRASKNDFSKLLVAGRIDAGGLRVSRTQIEEFKNERGYLHFLETSAKADIGCGELRKAIIDGIQWERIPWRSSPLLFKQLKEEIVRIKDSGQVLVRFNELREILQLQLLEDKRDMFSFFKDEELKTVVNLLAGPGVVWELKFGSWILLQPERINAYAQAVIQTIREDEQERGCLLEERVLKGDLTYHSSMPRLESDEERFVLLAMHQALVERGLCLREQTDKGCLLIFPSYYRRERPELVGHPAILVSYGFRGFLDDIYATLVVRLHHTHPFQQDQLWRYAADFKTLTGKQLGVKLTRKGEGAAELEVYFDSAIDDGEKIIFSQYVHEHLLQNARDVVRLRHYVCPHCFTPVNNREVAMRKLGEGKKDILCVNCEKRVPLWDQLEELFASEEMKQMVHELQKQSTVVLDTADKERTLVGEVISTVSLAGQICRELSVSDNGIDMEIEFKSSEGQATGRKIYLQLKSGDSHLTKRIRDGAEIFRIEKTRHADYWREQAFPVLLVIRSSKGEIRWMEVRDWLKRESDNGKKPVKQIVFQGERLDVMSVRRWRDNALGRS